MKILRPALEEVIVDNDSSKRVFRFVKDEGHVSSFGYEWTHYPRTFSHSVSGVPISKTRLETNLGFPVEFVKGMNILEIGCGAGRFTSIFADHAKHVVAFDLSQSVYANEALGRENVTVMQANLYDLPELSEPIDLVFCRGVIQFTGDTHGSLKKIFEYCRPGGLVIFDVYKKYWWDKLNFKYFWRPVFKRFISIDTFDRFINKHGSFLYRFHHRYLRIVAAIPVFRVIIGKTPLYLGINWEKQYHYLTPQQRLELFKNDLINTFYSEYDQPMSTDEVIQTLAEIGQMPYSFDVFRNYFRYKKSENTNPIKVRITKHGVYPS